MNTGAKQKLMIKAGFKCTYCGTGVSNQNHMTLDHVYPKALGGKGKENLACVCRTCNSKKADMLLTDFIKKFNIKITPEIARFL